MTPDSLFGQVILMDGDMTSRLTKPWQKFAIETDILSPTPKKTGKKKGSKVA